MRKFVQILIRIVLVVSFLVQAAPIFAQEDQQTGPDQTPGKPILVQVVSQKTATKAGIDIPSNPDQFNCIWIGHLIRIVVRVFTPMAMLDSGASRCNDSSYTSYEGTAALKSLGLAAVPTIQSSEFLPEGFTALNAVPASKIPYELETQTRAADLLALTQLEEPQTATRSQLVGVWRLGNISEASMQQADDLLLSRVWKQIIDIASRYGNMVFEPGDEVFSAPYGASVILGEPCRLVSYPANFVSTTPLPVIGGTYDVWTLHAWNSTVLDSCGSQQGSPIDLSPYVWTRFRVSYARATQQSRDYVEEAIKDWDLRTPYQIPIQEESDDGVLQRVGNGIMYTFVFGLSTYVYLETRGAIGLMDGSYLIVFENSNQ